MFLNTCESQVKMSVIKIHENFRPCTLNTENEFEEIFL